MACGWGHRLRRCSRNGGWAVECRNRRGASPLSPRRRACSQASCQPAAGCCFTGLLFYRAAASHPAPSLPLQLGFHAKPVGVLNVRGFFDGLLAFLDHATSEVSSSRVSQTPWAGRGRADACGGGGGLCRPPGLRSLSGEHC